MMKKSKGPHKPRRLPRKPPYEVDREDERVVVFEPVEEDRGLRIELPRGLLRGNPFEALGIAAEQRSAEERMQSLPTHRDAYEPPPRMSPRERTWEDGYYERCRARYEKFKADRESARQDEEWLDCWR